MSARKDLLRSYLLTLLAEGRFTTASYGSMLEKACALFAEDAAAVLVEIVEMAALNGVDAVGDKVLDGIKKRVSRFFVTAEREGIASAAAGLWDSIKGVYQRGVDAKRR